MQRIEHGPEDIALDAQHRQHARLLFQRARMLFDVSESGWLNPTMHDSGATLAGAMGRRTSKFRYGRLALRVAIQKDENVST
jgi:hypothetical protein